MIKLSKKNIIYLLILVSIVVFVFGIVLFIIIGVKDMNLLIVIDSLIKMEDGINMRIVKDVRFLRVIVVVFVGGFLVVFGVIM